MQNMTESELDKIMYELLDKYLENTFKSTKKVTTNEKQYDIIIAQEEK